MDFLVSYTEDRDWAEWIASHLEALGYGYALEEPPSGREWTRSPPPKRLSSTTST